jgi:hypothetical protein
MFDPNEQPRDLSDDLELGQEDAARAVGGDVKPTATQKPAEYLVFKLDTAMLTAPPFAP